MTILVVVSSQQQQRQDDNDLRLGNQQGPISYYGIRQKQSELSADVLCPMLDLASFQKVSFETGEIVVRDARGEPCFLLNIQAYIKFNKTLFFPLSQYKKFPSVLTRTKFGPLPALSSHALDNSNGQAIDNFCSGHELNELASGDNKQVKTGKVAGTDNAFIEDITVIVNCGLLRLRILVDASRLVLSTLFFYSLDPTTMSPAKNTQSQQSMLLFKSDSDCNNPLIAIPIGARYLCESRVVLRNNALLTEFYVEKLELKRIAQEYQQIQAPTGVLTAKHVAAASGFGDKPSQRPVPILQVQRQDTRPFLTQSQIVNTQDPAYQFSNSLKLRRSIDFTQPTLSKIKPKRKNQQDNNISAPKIQSIHFETVVCERTVSSKPLDRFMEQKSIDDIMILPAAWRAESAVSAAESLLNQQMYICFMIITKLAMILKTFILSSL